MFQKALSGLAATIAALMIWAAGAQAAEFSGKLFQSLDGRPIHGLVFVSGQKTRVELLSKQGITATISRADLKLTWVLYLNHKVYRVLKGVVIGPLSGAASVRDPLLVQRLDMGKEKVNGYLCDKVYYKYRDEKRGKIMEWFSPELDYPVRIIYKGPDSAVATEFSEIKVGPQKPEYFEVPKDFRKLPR